MLENLQACYFKNLMIYSFQEDQDWGIVAMVLDRLFLYMFGASALFGSYMILSNSPEEDPEHTEPIDIIHSKIAAEDRMSSALLD